MGRGAESWKGSGELTRVTGKGELGAACGSSPELRDHFRLTLLGKRATKQPRTPATWMEAMYGIMRRAFASCEEPGVLDFFWNCSASGRPLWQIDRVCSPLQMESCLSGIRL
ncbi:unnamed protein product [Lampetra planeri]